MNQLKRVVDVRSPRVRSGYPLDPQSIVIGLRYPSIRNRVRQSKWLREDKEEVGSL